MKFEHVEGVKKGKVILFALSTCVWCKRTKQLLNNLGIEYDYVFVDLLSGAEKAAAVKELERWNPRSSFPTIVINEAKCIVGFKEDEIKEALR
jgi:glutaredoxin-like protein NrdH